MAISNMRPGWLVAYALAFAAALLTRIIRLCVCLRRMGWPLPFAECYICTLEPALLGAVTPGRLGEFSRAGDLNSSGVPLFESLALSVLERLVDFAVLCLVGLAGCVYIFYGGEYRLHLTTAIIATLPATALILLYVVDLQRLSDFVVCLVQRLLPDRFFSKGTVFTKVAQKLFMQTFGAHLLFSSFGLFLCLLQIYCLAEAFSIVADRLVILFSYSSATLISLLPVSFAGLGTRDITYIYILGRVGVTREQALLFSLLDGLVIPVLGLLLLLIPYRAIQLFKSLKKNYPNGLG